MYMHCVNLENPELFDCTYLRDRCKKDIPDMDEKDARQCNRGPVSEQDRFLVM